MKKILILTAALLTGGLALPAAAQHRSHYTSQTEVYISGYLPCGSPIYSRRVVSHRNHRAHNHSRHEYEARLQRERELRRYAELRRQQAIRREIERRRYISSSRSYHRGGSSYHCR